MLFSYQWLKSYFPTEANWPTAEALATGLIFHAYEVEAVKPVGDDYLLEVKVLPDRAHDCLCHRGLAREIAVIFNLPLLLTPVSQAVAELSDKPAVKIIAKKSCRRYLSRQIKGVKVGPTTEMIKKRLASLGQHSINNLVDGANYLLWDIGQPTHVFDADLVTGPLEVRWASAGEKFITLDDQEVSLSSEMVVIADQLGVLALAGIKGGKRAGINSQTRNLILESANFDPINIRRTSQQLGLRTDASKRFENNLSPTLALEGMNRLTEIICQSSETPCQLGEVVDYYPAPSQELTLIFDPTAVARKLGVTIEPSISQKILADLGIGVKDLGDKWELLIPAWRSDLQIEANILEELGRIYGYEKIPAHRPREMSVASVNLADRKYDLILKVKEIFLQAGLSEIYGYALTATGEVELANPLAEDKSCLRNNLSDNLKNKLVDNWRYYQIFDQQILGLFEVGQVFSIGGEETRVAFAVALKGNKSAIKERLRELAEGIFTDWRRHFDPGIQAEVVFDDRDGLSLLSCELPLSELQQNPLSQPSSDLSPYLAGPITYQVFSPYPRIIRDIALYVPEDTEVVTVAQVLKDQAGPLLVHGPYLFDDYRQAGRRSLAWRLVFQASDRTLSDGEVNQIVDQLVLALENKAEWQVRQ